MSPPQAILAEIEALPWPEVIPLFIQILEAIDKSAANPIEKIGLEVAIAILQKVAPPGAST